MDSTTTATTPNPEIITEPQVKFNDKLNVVDNYCVLSSHHASTSFLKSKAQVFSWGHGAFCVSAAMLTSTPTLLRLPPFSNEWNGLPNHIRESNSIATFKRNVLSFIRDN